MNRRPTSLGSVCTGLACVILLLVPALQPLAAQQSPPLTPPALPESPISQFRAWLLLPPTARPGALSDQPESVRRVLLTKLAEYDALEPTQRERRLHATELQYYLRPLLRLNPDQRAARLPAVPAEFQPAIGVLLAQWDTLAPATRQQLLDNAWAIRYFVRLEAGTNADRTAVEQELPSRRREEFDLEFSRWKSLPLSQRLEITRNFHHFFELPPTKQQRTLGTLPESERRQIEATLNQFARLAPAQRQVCIDSFRKFAGLSPAERAKFLRNADRWKEMSLEDRAAWRRLVTQLPPFPPATSNQSLPPAPTPNLPVAPHLTPNPANAP